MTVAVATPFNMDEQAFLQNDGSADRALRPVQLGALFRGP